MKKFLLASAALVAMSVTASAADLPRKAPPPMVPLAPVYNWNGFYFGVMGGYGWSDELSATIGGVTFTTTSDDLKGGFVGGTIGYNFAPAGSSWLFGLEVDAAWANITAGRTGVILPLITGAGVSDKIEAIGSVTGRLGWTWGPGLLYAKGGFAWAENTVSVSVAGPLVGPPGVVVNASQSEFITGWTVGGGLEYMFAPNWSAKVEYMFADFDSTTFGGNIIPGGVDLGKSIHTIKGGINYRFDWGAAPLVARY